MKAADQKATEETKSATAAAKESKTEASKEMKTADQKAAEKTESATAAAKADSKDEAVGKTDDGKTVYAGSRNGHYYVNDKGDKTYVKDFVGAKVIGKTKSGQDIYEGPKGGHYYYNSNGNKTYVSDGKK